MEINIEVVESLLVLLVVGQINTCLKQAQTDGAQTVAVLIAELDGYLTLLVGLLVVLVTLHSGLEGNLTSCEHTVGIHGVVLLHHGIGGLRIVFFLELFVS